MISSLIKKIVSFRKPRKIVSIYSWTIIETRSTKSKKWMKRLVGETTLGIRISSEIEEIDMEELFIDTKSGSRYLIIGQQVMTDKCRKTLDSLAETTDFEWKISEDYEPRDERLSVLWPRS